MDRIVNASNEIEKRRAADWALCWRQLTDYLAAQHSGSSDEYEAEEWRLMSTYLDIYNAPPTSRIQMIRGRVSRSRLTSLSKALGLSSTVLAADLSIGSGSNERLSQTQSERIIGLLSLVGRVEKMNTASEAKEFDAPRWLGAWLDTPLPALAGERPGAYLDTMTGQDLLASLLAISESGAYA